jgi:DNA-binding transcriptional LysR family regulator
MDRLSNIIAFVTVAETGSFAETARKLNIANSVVSKRIKDLEEFLGVRLIQRSTRSLRLTDVGYQYFDQTRRMIHELAETEENIRYRNENPVGELKVSAPVSFGTEFLGPALSSYLEKYPDVTIKLHLTDLMVDLRGEGYDVAIATGDIADTSVIAKKLAESRRVVVASPAYLKEHGRPERPQDLGAHNCMNYTHMLNGKHWPFRVNGRRHLQLVGGRFMANNGMLLREAAVNGCGITMLPTFLVGTQVAAGDLELLLEDFEEEPLIIRAAYVQQRLLSARTRTFIDHLAKYFSGFAE